MAGPRSEPPMPMFTTAEIRCPVWPVHSPDRIRSATASSRSSTSCTSATTSCPSTCRRMPRDIRLQVDGQDVVADVHEVLDRLEAVADRIRSGEWTGHTGQRISAVVNIGIGGSDLGPAMAHQALADYAAAGIT